MRKKIPSQPSFIVLMVVSLMATMVLSAKGFSQGDTAAEGPFPGEEGATPLRFPIRIEQTKEKEHRELQLKTGTDEAWQMRPPYLPDSGKAKRYCTNNRTTGEPPAQEPQNQSSGGATTPQAAKPEDETVVAEPEQIESKYVAFKANNPLAPGSLNLFQYETNRVAHGWQILTPDKSYMAVTDVYFLPHNRQSISRVYLYPVGEMPELEDLVPPERLAAMKQAHEAQQAKIKKKNPNAPEQPLQITLKDVDPNAFWNRYQPERQIRYRKTLFEQGFDTSEEHRADIVQVVDWTPNQQQLLMVWRPSYHHLGVIKSIPVVYNLNDQRSVKHTILPKRIWEDFLKRFPELKIPENRVWDIRPLGWNSDAPNQEIIVKLVQFDGQSEISSGFWSYDTWANQLRFLGGAICPQQVTRNGWTVQYLDPADPTGPKVYEPGEKRPTTEERQLAYKQERSVKRKLLFWKKQRRLDVNQPTWTRF